MSTSDSAYLDYAAATPMSDAVFRAMQPYYGEKFYNPSSPYAPAVQVRREYEAAKKRLAATFGAKGDELVMTAGATESINLAFSGITGHVVTSAIEHVAVLEAAKRHDHTLVMPDEKGLVPAIAVERALTPDTQLVSIGLANSELGTLQPLRKIAALIQAERQARGEKGNTTPLLFHVDASQGFGLVDVHVARLGADMLTLNSGKIYGPKQVGLLWSKHASHLQPQVVGGGQERGLRSGTENVAGVIGFAEAAAQAAGHQSAENKRLGELRDQLEIKLLAAFPEAVVTGAKKHRLPNFLHISFPGLDAERLIFMLETKGVFVATGSACAANKHTASHVLQALNMSDEIINGSLRITLGKQTDQAVISKASEAIVATVQAEYERTRA